MRGQSFVKSHLRHTGVAFLLAVGAILLLGLAVLLAPELLKLKVGSDRAVIGVETEPTLAAQPENWQLTLVNSQHPLPTDRPVSLTRMQNGQAVDSRIYPALQEMLAAAEDDGVLIGINSSWRSDGEQQDIMDEEVADYMAKGSSEAEARKLAAQWVALPGTSEHQLGLAVDLSTPNSRIQDADGVWTWLIDNSYRYGFIRRYPPEKSDITGISNEPWHYRYVGKEAAREMHERNLCLEEYLEMKGAA